MLTIPDARKARETARAEAEERAERRERRAFLVVYLVMALCVVIELVFLAFAYRLVGDAARVAMWSGALFGVLPLFILVIWQARREGR